MKAEITKQIQDIIKKDLPAQVGAALQERLIEADQMETDIDRLGKDYKKATNRLADRDTENAKLKADLDKHEALEEREATVKERENQQEIKELTTKLECAEITNQKVMGFVDGLMRNTEFRRNVYKQIGQDYNNDGTHSYEQGEDVTEKHE